MGVLERITTWDREVMRVLERITTWDREVSESVSRNELQPETER